MPLDVKNTNDIKPTKLNALIYAPSGNGKTTLAKTLGDKSLVVSLEAGLLSLKGCDVDYVEVDPLRKIESLREILGAVKSSDYDTVFIDSLSEISQAFLDLAKKEFPDARQTMPRFGYYNEVIMNFLKYTRDFDKNIIFTCLQKDEKDEVGRTNHLPNLVGSIRETCPAFFDFVFALRVLERDGEKIRALQTDTADGYLCKDRSGKLEQLEAANLGLVINKVFKEK